MRCGGTINTSPTPRKAQAAGVLAPPQGPGADECPGPQGTDRRGDQAGLLPNGAVRRTFSSHNEPEPTLRNVDNFPCLWDRDGLPPFARRPPVECDAGPPAPGRGEPDLRRCQLRPDLPARYRDPVS